MNTSHHHFLQKMFPTKEELSRALDDAYDVDIAVSIAKARHARGLTQVQLAKSLKTSQGYVAQLENANVLPSHKKLKLLARVLRAALVAPQLLVTSMEPSNNLVRLDFPNVSESTGFIHQSPVTINNNVYV